MTKTFAARLLERVLATFLISFVCTYVNVMFGGVDTTPALGQVGTLIKGLEDLSLLHKAVVAGMLALVQMALSAGIGPHVGDPNTPDLVPKRFLVGAVHAATATVAKFAASDELQHLLQQTAAANPNAPLTTEAVLAQAASREQAAQTHDYAAPSQPPPL